MTNVCADVSLNLCLGTMSVSMTCALITNSLNISNTTSTKQWVKCTAQNNSYGVHKGRHHVETNNELQGGWDGTITSSPPNEDANMHHEACHP